ncbi:MAG: hypothetical protein [Sanya solspi-like virus 4]|nr:MAG: hypothetical protein [Sanya solspi-like virus 4]
MALTINTRSYVQDRVNPDSVSYAGPANTLTIVDTFQMARVYPKPNGTFKGVAKPSAKLTKTLVINSTTGETGNAIVTLSASLPVGVASADVDTLLADIASFCTSADAKSLFKTLDITA